MRLSFHHVLVIFAVALLLCGCGSGRDPHGRQAISGAVNFKGQPLDPGTIQFIASETGKDASAGALIREGRYQIPREQGLPPGTYRVVITSPEANKTDGPIMPPGHPGVKMPPLGTERIPAKYNRETTLTAEVTDGGANSFDFNLEEKKP